MPRFVVLEHDFPRLHWDFLLEADGKLRAWRLAVPPLPGATIAAQQNADHRLFYLDHEGPVSGGRGAVQRFDAGVFDWVRDHSDALEVVLTGHKLHGNATFVRQNEFEWLARF